VCKRDPDEVIGRVLARFQHGDVATERTGGTRAALVLDPSARFLSDALKDANFQVIALSSDADSEARKNLLAHRIVVTKETTPYLDDAPVLDYGVVGLDALGGLDASLEYAENMIAQVISKAVAEFGLTFERSAYVIMLHPGGKRGLDGREIEVFCDPDPLDGRLERSPSCSGRGEGCSAART